MKNDANHRSAFTLLEMAIVLAILALLTHLAVVRLDSGSLKPAQTRKLLSEIDHAINGLPASVDAEGRPAPTGFLADMGRLPTSLTELWQCPDDATAYGPHQAADDPAIWVPGGWRGPYVKPGRGGERFLDPWGNELEALAQEDGSLVVRSLGSDGAPGWDGATEPARDMGFTNPPPICVLTVIPYFYGKSAPSNAADVADADGEERPTRLYGYSSRGGTILVQCSDSDVQMIASGTPVQAEGLTPGYGAFRLEREGIRGPIHPVVLRPGTNVVVVTERR